MNHYCKPTEPQSHMARLGRQGLLREVDVPRRTHSAYCWESRSEYVDTVSWAIFTVEYQESLVRLIGNRRVLEVCAGHGVLAQAMRRRGVDWTATDKLPPNDQVIKMGAVTAIKIYKPDIVFASWIPYRSTVDFKIAKLGRPIILVGEGGGGCTGSDRLEERDRFNQIWRIRDYLPWFKDVPQWAGIHDYTSIVLPKRMTPEAFFAGG